MPRAGLTPTKVTQAAADLADADGLDRLTLAAVAGVLGVKTPSLYNHAKGLDGLLLDLAVLGYRRLSEAVGQAALGSSGRDAILAIARAYRRFATTHPGLYEAMMRIPDAAHSDSPELREAASGALGVVSRVLEPAGLDPDNSIHLLRGLRAAMHGFSDLERAGGFGFDVDLDESYTRMIRLLASGSGQ